MQKVHVPAGQPPPPPTFAPSVEPLQLQVVCHQLWEDLDDADSEIDLGDVEKLNVDGALRRYYDEQVRDTVENTAVDEPELRDWFQSDLTTDDGFRRQVRTGPPIDGANVLEAPTDPAREWRSTGRLSRLFARL